MHLSPVRFDPSVATERAFVALNDLENRRNEEQWPDDPPRTLEQTIQGHRSQVDFEERSTWIVRDSQVVVASANTCVFRTKENQHLLHFDVYVRPERRRRGIGRALLLAIEAAARDERRRLLISETDSMTDAGDLVMSRVGGNVGMRSRVYHLDLDRVDHGLLNHWMTRANERADGFEIGIWKAAYPEEDIDSILELAKVMNTAPRDDLDIEDGHTTREEMREWERVMSEQGESRWTMYARHSRSGELAGYTDIFFEDTQPSLIHQGETGVFPRFRNRGIGRWLKAAMCQTLLRERPAVKLMRLANADSNAAMLRINQEMGYVEYKALTIWQLDTARLRQYLDG